MNIWTHLKAFFGPVAELEVFESTVFIFCFLGALRTLGSNGLKGHAEPSPINSRIFILTLSLTQGLNYCILMNVIVMVLIQKQHVSAPEITSNHANVHFFQFDQYLCSQADSSIFQVCDIWWAISGILIACSEKVAWAAILQNPNWRLIGNPCPCPWPAHSAQCQNKV